MGFKTWHIETGSCHLYGVKTLGRMMQMKPSLYLRSVQNPYVIFWTKTESYLLVLQDGLRHEDVFYKHHLQGFLARLMCLK